GGALSARSGDSVTDTSAAAAGAVLSSVLVADTGPDGIPSAPAAPDRVIKQIQAGRNRCRIMSPNWREHARAAHRNAPLSISKRRSPSRGPRHAVETGLFFGERVERIRTSPPRDCRSSPPNRFINSPEGLNCPITSCQRLWGV